MLWKVFSLSNKVEDYVFYIWATGLEAIYKMKLLISFNSSVGKTSTCNAGDPGSIPGSGRSTGEGIGYPLQYSWASLVAQLVKNPSACGRPGLDPWVGNSPWRRERLLIPVLWPGEFQGLYSPWRRKESDTTEWLSLSLCQKTCSVLLHCFRNILRVSQVAQWVKNLNQEDPLEAGQAIHSSILAWRVPWTKEPSGLQSTGSPRVGDNWEHTQRDFNV